jgi:hypothetical protein
MDCITNTLLVILVSMKGEKLSYFCFPLTRRSLAHKNYVRSYIMVTQQTMRIGEAISNKQLNIQKVNMT